MYDTTSFREKGQSHHITILQEEAAPHMAKTFRYSCPISSDIAMTIITAAAVAAFTTDSTPTPAATHLYSRTYECY